MSGVIEARFRDRLGAFALDVDFTAPATGTTALFGHSGCGKTTVLRCVAGLHRALRGRFSLDGDVWQDDGSFRPTHSRPIGYVFQEASLFPHLSVRANLNYGLRRSHRRGLVTNIRFDDVAELLGIGRLLDRAPDKLSGGERQRVAIARALLAQPRLLLMDEPLAALDRFAKDEILPYLERLRDTLAIPILYVSHDLAEVERLADHLILLKDGRVAAAGALETLQTDPRLSIARMPEAGATLAATIAAFDARYGLTVLDINGGQLVVPGELGPLGGRRRAHIAATDVSLTRSPASDSSILNILPARVERAEPLDVSRVIAGLVLGENGEGGRILSRLTRKSWDKLGLSSGDLVFAQVKSVALALPGEMDGDEIHR